ncbi:hypothetical protein MASR1M66_21250 [Aminivibrio sp.]
MGRSVAVACFKAFLRRAGLVIKGIGIARCDVRAIALSSRIRACWRPRAWTRTTDSAGGSWARDDRGIVAAATDRTGYGELEAGALASLRARMRVLVDGLAPGHLFDDADKAFSSTRTFVAT